MTLTCSKCGREIAERDAYHGVHGWERKSSIASRRSGSDITLRRQTGELACSECITRLKTGLDVNQGTLV